CCIKILSASFRDAAQPNEVGNFLTDHWHGSRIDIGRDATGATQRNQMPDQSVAGDIGGCADKATLSKFGAYNVNLRHQRDYVSAERARSDSAFDCRGSDAGAERFRQHKQISGTRICIGSDAPNIDDPRDGEPINRFRITNGMAANDHASYLSCLGKAAAQNRRNYSWPNKVGRKPDNVECGQWAPAHGENVRKRVRRGDLSIRKWVVHD